MQNTRTTRKSCIGLEMTKQSNQNLFDALVAAMPLSFLEDMATAVPHLFAEAYNEFSNSAVVDSSQVPVLVPHYRRSLFETKFLRCAEQAGLKVQVRTTKRGASNFVVVEAGKFVFTASFVASRGQSVRNADFRTEHSELNELLDQQDLFKDEEERKPLSRDSINNSESIYGILLYGGDLTGKSHFMEFGFPTVGSSGYVDHYSFGDVLVAAREYALPAVQTEVKDGAVPTLKPHAIPKVIEKDGTTDSAT